MFRRNLLKWVGAATGLSIGGSGVTSAQLGDVEPADEELFPSLKTIEEWHEIAAEYVPRYPGTSTSHEYLDWIENQLGDVRGIHPHQIERKQWELDRWEEKQARLRIREGNGPPESVPLVRSVPWTLPTGGSGISAPVTYVPPETDIRDADVEGKIVLRDVPTGSIPYAAFTVNNYFTWDPEATINYAGEYERGWLASWELGTDLEMAEAKNAAGILFGLGFPMDQKKGHYRPYHGEFFDIPGLFLGVDERERIKSRLDNGNVTARIRLEANRELSKAYDLHATLKGNSDERIVIYTHSDGPNVLEENGPIALLTLANYFSSLPSDANPWTIEFVFQDAHFAYGQRPPIFEEAVDDAYEDGDVALAIALEHLGVREYVAVERDGAPGRKVELSGLNEPAAIFSTESPALVENLIESVVGRDLRRTSILRGVDEPGPTFPPHQDYGGIGSATHNEAIPTVAFISAPWVLFDPQYNLEAIDYDLFRRQVLAFADFLHRIEGLPPAVIAGADTAYREAQDAGLDGG